MKGEVWNFMKQREVIEESANRILQANPDPVVRFRLLRDVLRVSSADLVTRAKQEMLGSRWVSELKREQENDGSWGRFHSMDSRSERKIKTTEIGVERGLALGLVATDPIFRKTVSYLSRLLERSVDFPDRPERNDRWPAARQLFVAATLARIEPNLPVLDVAWELWATIAARTFASGKYDADAEILAHRELTGASVRDSFLVVSNRYAVTLLGSRATRLSNNVEKAFLAWIWKEKKVIGYLSVPLTSSSVHLSAKTLDGWFTSIELLSQFPSWHGTAKNVIDWLWTQRDKEGLWDFGPMTQTSHYFPLSESWKKKRNRKHDYSTRVLSLLRHCCDFE